MVGSGHALEAEGWAGAGPADGHPGICPSIRGSASRFSAGSSSSCPPPGSPALTHWFPAPVFPGPPGWAGAAPREGRGSDRDWQPAPHLLSSPLQIRWEKNITLGEPPGFLHSWWWCVRGGAGGPWRGPGWGRVGKPSPPLPPTACSGTCTVQRLTAERRVSTRAKPRLSRTM